MRMRAVDWLAVVVLLLFAAALRFIAVDFGQPEPLYANSTLPVSMLHDQTPLHPDEFLFITRPFRMLLTGHPNPQFFENPLFLINTNFVTFWLTDSGRGLTHEERLTGNFRNYAPFPLYVIGRVYSALGGILAVAGAYATARLMAGRYAALVAGLLATVALTLVQHAHYATTSSLSAGFVMLCIWASFASLRAKTSRQRWVLFALGGIAAGLAAGNRYNAAAVSLVVFFTGWVLLYRQRDIAAAGRVLVGWLLFPLIFLFTTIQLFFDFDGFQRDFQSISTQYLSGLDRINSVSPWTGLLLEYQYLFGMVLGVPAMMLCVLALLPLFQRKQDLSRIYSSQIRQYLVLVLIYLVPYSLVILRTVRPNGADQLLIPVIPVFALLAGVGFAWVISQVKQYRLIIRPLLVLLVVSAPLMFSVQLLWLLNQPDTRQQMQAWVHQHLPQGSRIHLVGPYNVPVDYGDYELTQSFSDFETARELRSSGVDYLIFSDALYHPAQGANAAYLASIDTARASWDAAGFSPMAHIQRPDWWVAGYSGLHTPSYWHHPGLTVYCLTIEACRTFQ